MMSSPAYDVVKTTQWVWTILKICYQYINRIISEPVYERTEPTYEDIPTATTADYETCNN